MAAEQLICDTDVLIELFDREKVRLIAATALEAKLKLFTYNLRDFTFIKGLNLHT